LWIRYIHVRAAEQARECVARLDRNDPKGARDRAERGFAISPNHPSSAMCLHRTFEASRAGADSLIFALEKAVRGDSMNTRAWERLGREYMQKNDTTKALAAMERQLGANRNDQALRTRIIALQLAAKKYPDAIRHLDESLERAPEDAQTLRLKAGACLDSQTWTCALDAM
jgi:tetratricopeptide (TPR) repeat protein